MACGDADAEQASSQLRIETAPLGVATFDQELELRVPRPTGPFAVGVRKTFVVDASRSDAQTGQPRALPTWIYYPALHDASAKPARYLSPAVQAALEQGLEWPAGTLDVDSGILDAPRARPYHRGVLLVSGGWATPAAFNTALIGELASHGWLLVAFDHPHDTILCEQPNGASIPGLQVSGEAAFAPRVLDVKVVLEQLPALVPGFKASTPVAMWGHSMGGATAVEALRLYPRLVAAVDIDGTPRGGVVELGTNEPVGVMSSGAFINQTGSPDPLLQKLISNLDGPHPIKNLYDLEHYGFSDLVVLTPQARAIDPALGDTMESKLVTGAESLQEGRDAIAMQRRFLVNFMSRHVDRR
jgi:pimeloyl-ACP methyl ester carboxylesterase